MKKGKYQSGERQLDQSIHNKYNKGNQIGKIKQSNQTMEDVVSDRVSEEIVDDLAVLRNKENQTPLMFYWRFGSSYLISFPKKQVPAFLVRYILLLFFMIAVQVFVYTVAKVQYQLKLLLTVLTIIEMFSYILLFFLDPGTLFQDEQQRIYEERLYCQVCKIYRGQKSHHCIFCGKCVRGYDHHCGFFGKCIAGRNIWLFCLFLTTVFVYGIAMIACLIFTALNFVVLNKYHQGIKG